MNTLLRGTDSGLRAGSLGIESWSIHFPAMTSDKSLSFLSPQFTLQPEGTRVAVLSLSQEGCEFLETGSLPAQKRAAVSPGKR